MTTHNLAKYIVVAAIIVAVAAFRSAYIAAYGTNVPFWDQWDLLRLTLEPWQNGHLPAGELFQPHNEHRILFTRLISMALLTAGNGVWSNLREAYANTAIYAAVLALFYWLASKGLVGKLRHAMLVLGIIAVGSLPFDWENNLVGFQNQFYLMVAMAAAMVGVAAQRSMSGRSYILLLVLGVASLFTTAGGVLSTLVVIGTLALRYLANQRSTGYMLSVSVTMLVLLAVGLALVPSIPDHEVLKAHGLKDFLHAVAAMLIWPWQPLTKLRVWLIPVIWLPSIVWFCRFWVIRKASPGELFAAGMLGWAVLQAVAFAHARGHGALDIPSRYMNIVSTGLLSNLTLALYLLGRRLLPFTKDHRYAFKVITIAAWLGVIGMALAHRTPADMAAMQQRAGFNQVETFYIRRYLQTLDPSYLQHAPLMIPYINAEALITYLQNPALRKMLPASGGAQPTAPAVATWLSGLLKLPPVATRFVSRAQPATMPPGQAAGRCDFSFNFISERAQMKSVSAKVDDPVIFNGWLINPAAPAKKGFAIVLNGKRDYYLDALPNGTREDVVAAFHSSAEQSVGFFTTGLLADIEPGVYDVVLAEPGPNGQLICAPDPVVRLTVLDKAAGASSNGL